MKTHKVIDLHYSESEGNIDFVGTFEECQDYYEEQCKMSSADSFMLRIENLSSSEYKAYNSDEDENAEEEKQFNV